MWTTCTSACQMQVPRSPWAYRITISRGMALESVSSFELPQWFCALYTWEPLICIIKARCLYGLHGLHSWALAYLSSLIFHNQTHIELVIVHTHFPVQLLYAVLPPALKNSPSVLPCKLLHIF